MIYRHIHGYNLYVEQFWISNQKRAYNWADCMLSKYAAKMKKWLIAKYSGNRHNVVRCIQLYGVELD